MPINALVTSWWTLILEILLMMFPIPKKASYKSFSSFFLFDIIALMCAINPPIAKSIFPVPTGWGIVFPLLPANVFTSSFNLPILISDLLLKSLSSLEGCFLEEALPGTREHPCPSIPIALVSTNTTFWASGSTPIFLQKSLFLRISTQPWGKVLGIVCCSLFSCPLPATTFLAAFEIILSADCEFTGIDFS